MFITTSGNIKIGVNGDVSPTNSLTVLGPVKFGEFPEKVDVTSANSSANIALEVFNAPSRRRPYAIPRIGLTGNTSNGINEYR